MKNLPQELIDFIKARSIMSLATYGDKIWICTAYYVLDKDLNLYFISPPDSEHIENINKNNHVACNIFDSNQIISDEKVGLQFTGTVEQVSSLDQAKWFFKVLKELNPGIADILNFKRYKAKDFSSRVYKITPTRYKFFNEALYDDQFEVFE